VRYIAHLAHRGVLKHEIVVAQKPIKVVALSSLFFDLYRGFKALSVALGSGSHGFGGCFD